MGRVVETLADRNATVCCSYHWQFVREEACVARLTREGGGRYAPERFRKQGFLEEPRGLEKCDLCESGRGLFT